MTVTAYYFFETTGGEESLRAVSLHNAKGLFWRAAGHDVLAHIAGNEERDVRVAAEGLSKVAGVRSVRRVDSSAPSIEATEGELTAAQEKLQATHVDDPESELGKARRQFLSDGVRKLSAGLQATQKIKAHAKALDDAIRRMEGPLDFLLAAWKRPLGDDPDEAALATQSEVRVRSALEDIDKLATELKP